MTPVIAELTEALGELISLLEIYGEKHWAKWLNRDYASLLTGSTQSIEHLLLAYGGMGSLNDIYICPENKHAIQASNVEVVNEKISALTSRVYSLAQKVKHNAEP